MGFSFPLAPETTTSIASEHTSHPGDPLRGHLVVGSMAVVRFEGFDRVPNY